MDMIDHGDALLSIYANDPDIYQGLDTERLSAMQKSHLQNYQEISAKVTRNAINWCVVASVSPAWAAKLFPNLKPEDAEEKLWQAIFETTHAVTPDPVAAWGEHIRNLRKRSDYMQAKKYSGLHYKSQDTDFTLGLPLGHKWISAQSWRRTALYSLPICPQRKFLRCLTVTVQMERSLPHFRSATGEV